MNPVEIEEAISILADQPFDMGEFPFLFLQAFGNKETTLERLRSGNSNASDVPGGVLQRNNIHMATCSPGLVGDTLKALRESPKTSQCKAKFILATDGVTLEAEDINSGETIATDYRDFPKHFGFFLPLAGISIGKELKDNPVDIKATGRLNRLYLELLKHNPEWSKPERRADMNHFMARLIFCFFAEDTGIFHSDGLFTSTIEQMSVADGSNTSSVMSEIFRAMNTAIADRASSKLPNWADCFPYVNGGLFSGSTETPDFTRTARSFLIQAGALNWKEINPDIFGSMIQAVADDDERGALGMHYTSVPNILKVLNPLFLDDLRAELEKAGKNVAKLKKLRRRMATIRVFDPACGSGNFLVIAYKQMREIEAQINQRLGDPKCKSGIPKTNFRGIELHDFPAEIARLSLIIAEFQCDELYRDRNLALAEFLPLDKRNWITCGNALRLDWLAICPPTGSSVRLVSDDLFHAPLDQTEIDFENEGGETYICGNPPYLGSTWQSSEQKSDLKALFDGRTKNWKSLDYVSGWFMKAADYGTHTNAVAAFVSTNSICQGQQVPILWPLIFSTGHEIAFAYTSFKWSNLASYNAGVTVAIVAISNHAGTTRRLFSIADDGLPIVRGVTNINAYLVAGQNVVVEKATNPLFSKVEMTKGNQPTDGGYLLLSTQEMSALGLTLEQHARFIRRIYGSAEFIRGLQRYCLWIGDQCLEEAMSIEPIRKRIEGVCKMRLESSKATTKVLAGCSHKFGEIRQTGSETVMIVPRHSSENRDFLPVGCFDAGTIVIDSAFALYDAPLWTVAIIASRLHLVWIATVCGKLKTDFRYSNTLGWNTFPVPSLTEQNKADLTRCAEEILLAREAHFPATIAELYDRITMPENLRYAHERNEEVLEQIYIGRRFRNDTERLEKLFELYGKLNKRNKEP